MLQYILALIAIYACSCAVTWYRKRKPSHLSNYKDVPWVEGCWPIVGHGFAFGKDIIGFVENARKKYGNIFRVKIFLIDMIICCERSVTGEFFKAHEDTLSLYDVLDRLYFGDGFADNPDSLPQIINLVRRTIAVRYDEFMPKIALEAHRMIGRIKEKCDGREIRLADEMIRFVACTSAQCFIAIELPDEVFEDLMTFTKKLNDIVPLTYFFPKWAIRAVMNPGLRKYRKKLTDFMKSEIQKYRDDPYKDDSLVFRKCVDYEDPESGRKLTDDEVGDVIVCLLYVSSENTALGLTATITDLAGSPDHWNRVRDETARYLHEKDYRGLMASPLVDACVMESARTNSHVFAMNRKPKDRNMTLGEYYVGSTDSVGLCQPQLMKLDHASDVFKDPGVYCPDRFLPPRSESKKSDVVNTWGSSTHLCPGKMFAVYEIKMAMALLTNTVKVKLPDGPLAPLNYFTASAFSERPLTVSLTLAEHKYIPPSKNDHFKNLEINNIKVEYYPEGGWLLRNYLSKADQKHFYQYTTNLSKGSSEQSAIESSPAHMAQPLTYHNLVYTGSSNCDRPAEWYEWANKCWNFLRSNKDTLHFPDREFNSNSLYAQLFSESATMKDHKDEFVDFGISVNLGASCDFTFGGKTIKLYSGDVFVADFSKVLHGVSAIHANTEPQWWTETQTFGKVRCSVQLRDVSHVKNNKMTDAEFKEMLIARNK